MHSATVPLRKATVSPRTNVTSSHALSAGAAFEKGAAAISDEDQAAYMAGKRYTATASTRAACNESESASAVPMILSAAHLTRSRSAAEKRAASVVAKIVGGRDASAASARTAVPSPPWASRAA